MIVVGNVMLKFAIAGAVLMFGLAASSAPAFAGPAADECVDCPVSPKYDSDEVVEKIRNNKSSLANEAPIDVRSGRTRAARSRDSDCADCAPRRRYDSQQVIKKVRNVDQSRVINTRTVVPVSTRVKETNSLVIRQHETRLTGVVRHNHTIIEKEVRYVRRVPVQTTVEFVTHNYRVVERPDTITVPVTLHRPTGCYRGRGYVGYGSCRPSLRVRG
jgi:hypothetical protein